jgi:hypothetical protein
MSFSPIDIAFHFRHTPDTTRLIGRLLHFSHADIIIFIYCASFRAELSQLSARLRRMVTADIIFRLKPAEIDGHYFIAAAGWPIRHDDYAETFSFSNITLIFILPEIYAIFVTFSLILLRFDGQPPH